MYFKRVELFGFKSFASRTKLTFEEGVTAIVGPNGSGKSNILDGIKWVLGEQSAKSLRGSAMQDVIFNGTANKEAINMAEVSLILDNKDKVLPIEYEEVVITRRLYRSGESEYLLNRLQVRLKDIEDILMGTGIGVSSYSIMEQGRMDQILNARPEDRRDIFEEAAGITKYKSKKKEALRKLEQTENNLLRVGDIVAEVKRQIGSIERQASRAQRYKEFFDKLKDLDLKISFIEKCRLKQGLEEMAAESRRLQSDIAALSTGINSAEERLGEHRRNLAAIGEGIAGIREELVRIDSSIENNRHKIGLNSERSQELNNRRALIQGEIAQTQERAAHLQRQIEEAKQEIASLEGVKKSRAEALRVCEMRLSQIADEILDAEAAIKDNKLKSVEILAAQSNCRNEVARTASEVQASQSRRRRLAVEKEEAGRELEEVAGRLSAAASEKEQAESLLAALRSEKEISGRQLEEFKNALLELDSKISVLSEELVRVHSKLEFLEDLKARREGFSSGVKNLLVQVEKNRLPKEEFCGVLADLVVPKDGFERAVEISLSELAQSVVVRHETTAAQAIDFLKNNGLGRVNFIALDTINGFAPKEFRHPAVLSRASDCVEVDPGYRRAVELLLNGVYIVEDLKTALTHQRQLDEHSCFVTRQGEMVRRYSVFGGGLGETEDEKLSIIGREAKISHMKAELKTLEEEKKLLCGARQKQDQRRHMLERQMTELAGRIHDLEVDVANRQSHYSNIEKDKKRLDEELSIVELELGEIQERLADLQTRQNELSVRLQMVERDYEESQRLIAQSQETVAKRASERETILVKIAEAKTELEHIGKEEDTKLDALRIYEESFQEQGRSRENRQRELEDILAKEQGLKEEAVRLNDEIRSLAAKKEALKRDHASTFEKRSALLEAQGRAEQDVKAAQGRVASFKDTLRDNTMKIQERTYKASGLRERLMQAYKEDIDQLSIEVEPSLDSAQTRTEIEYLRGKLESMGTVNLVAIEEHQELKERFDFLSKQEADLLKAKDDLKSAIQKINRTTKELFSETFAKIQVEFKSIFRMLFGGGKAELVMLNEEDILESGIEIVAQPPGKKLQTISLLSGGERAMTAIALMFSIFKVRPSPFCILDEVDAPLDESNIGRFSRVLQEFVKISQFIIITHNKKTLQLADVLYGVTMQQSGISRIVSVRFKDGAVSEEKDRAAEPEEPVTAAA